METDTARGEKGGWQRPRPREAGRTAARRHRRAGWQQAVQPGPPSVPAEQGGGRRRPEGRAGAAGPHAGAPGHQRPPTDAGPAEGVPLEANFASPHWCTPVSHSFTSARGGEQGTLRPWLSLCEGLPQAEEPWKAQAGWEAGRGEVGLTHTLGPVLAGVVASPTEQRVPLARVGAHGVDAAKAWPTGLGQRRTFVDVCRSSAGDGGPGTAESRVTQGGGRCGAPDQPWIGLQAHTVPVPCPMTPGPFPPRTSPAGRFLHSRSCPDEAAEGRGPPRTSS